MQNPTVIDLSASQTPALFWWLLAGLIGLALIPTVWTAVDMAGASPFIGTPPHWDSRSWFWVEWINLYVPTVFRLALLAALSTLVFFALKKTQLPWRLPLAFIVIAGTLGPGAVVNMGFKENWQRARPYQVQEFGGSKLFTRATVITDQCDNNCSFVSGHVSCGFFLATLMLVHRRRATRWAVVGLASGLIIGFSRMSAGAHWLSDVLWAGPITLLCSWVVWKCLLRFYKPCATVG